MTDPKSLMRQVWWWWAALVPTLLVIAVAYPESVLAVLVSFSLANIVFARTYIVRRAIHSSGGALRHPMPQTVPPVPQPASKRRYWQLAPFASVLLFLIALPVRSVWLAIFACGVFVLPFIQPIRVQYQAKRSLPAAAVVGSPLTCSYSITNDGPLSVSAGVFVDPVPGLGDVTFGLPAMRSGEHADVSMVVVPQRRSWTDATWDSSISGRGWFAGSITYAFQLGGRAPIVRPRLVPWTGAVPLLTLDVVGTGQLRAGAGTDVHGIRAWQPGDSTRAVHWRSTARAGAPMILEREEEFAQETLLVVADGGDGPAWEDAISRAAWLAQNSAHENRAYRIFAGIGTRPIGGDVPGSVAAVTSVDEALDWFAGLQSVGPIDLTPLFNYLRSSRAIGEIAVLTANPALVSAVGALSPHVRAVPVVRQDAVGGVS